MMGNFLQQLTTFAAAHTPKSAPSCNCSAVIPDHGLTDEASGTTEFQIFPPSSKHASDMRQGLTPGGDRFNPNCQLPWRSARLNAKARHDHVPRYPRTATVRADGCRLDLIVCRTLGFLYSGQTGELALIK